MIKKCLNMLHGNIEKEQKRVFEYTIGILDLNYIDNDVIIIKYMF